MKLQAVQILMHLERHQAIISHTHWHQKLRILLAVPPTIGGSALRVPATATAFGMSTRLVASTTTVLPPRVACPSALESANRINRMPLGMRKGKIA